MDISVNLARFAKKFINGNSPAKKKSGPKKGEYKQNLKLSSSVSYSPKNLSVWTKKKSFFFVMHMIDVALIILFINFKLNACPL